MIIIEGTDGTGKTTLAHELCAATGLEYRHLGPPPVSVRPEFYLENVGPYVWDRFHLGEEAYGAVCGSPRMTWPNRHAVRDRLYSLAFTIVLYASDDGWLRERYNKSRELYSLEQILLANHCFRIMAFSDWVDFGHDVCQGWLSPELVVEQAELMIP